MAHTWEGGGAWPLARRIVGGGGVPHANRDDIIFVSSGPLTNHGHFENVGTTSRERVWS